MFTSNFNQLLNSSSFEEKERLYTWDLRKNSQMRNKYFHFKLDMSVNLCKVDQKSKLIHLRFYAEVSQ